MRGKTGLLLSMTVVTFAIAAGVRLARIGDAAIQPDERLWVSRSAKLIEMLQTNPRRATTHLGHPGVAPAAVMAAAQWLQSRRMHSKPNFFERLVACRRGVALTAALTAPAVLWGLQAVLGLWPAFLAAMFIALDPHLIGYARMAHLDAVLALFVTATIVLYVRAVQTGRLSLKLLAGLTWGLAIATKPTAGLLVVGFILYRALRVAILPRAARTGEKSLLSWSDVGAIMAGHLVFGLCYTRLWDHLGDYRVRLNIQFWLAKWFWVIGIYLHRRPALMVLLGVLLIGSLLWLRRSWGKQVPRWHYHSAMLLTLSALFMIALAAFPQVFENFARYWRWAGGLTAEKHLTYGHLKPPPRLGYLAFLLSELPTMALLGLVLSLMIAAPRCLRRCAGEVEVLLCFCLCAGVCWMLPLNMSDKQTWRYAAPIVPCLLIAAAGGYQQLFTFLKQPRVVFAPCVVAMAGVLSWQVFSWAPQYGLFYNLLSGGLSGAAQRQQGLPLVGLRETAAWLVEKAKQQGSEIIYVTVLQGDEEFEREAFAAKGDDAKQVRFGYHRLERSDYLVYLRGQEEVIPLKGWEQVVASPPLFSFVVKGVPLATIHEVPLYDYPQPITLRIFKGFRHTGTPQFVGGVQVVGAEPKRHHDGTLFFNEGLRLPPGEFVLSAPVKLQPAKAPSDGAPLLRLELGADCVREVRAEDLTSQAFTVVAVNCPVTDPGRHVPRVWWYGTTPVFVGDLTLTPAGNLFMAPAR